MVKTENFKKNILHWEILIPSGYPYSAPKVFNLEKIIHPAVCPRSGLAKLDFLTSKWSPVLRLTSIIYALKLFMVGALEDFEPQDILHRDFNSNFRTSDDSSQMNSEY